MDLTKKQLIELVQFATGKIHSSFTWEDEAEDTVDEYLKAVNYTHCCETLNEISKIVDKIVEETPLLCMPDDKQMQRDSLKEKWTNWFKKEYNL